MSPRRARMIQVILALIGLGAGSATFLGSLVLGPSWPWLLRGALALAVIGVLALRRRAFRRANEEAGNRVLALQLKARREAGRGITEEQARFVRRLTSPWWRNGYWLVAGGRILDEPPRT